MLRESLWEGCAKRPLARSPRPLSLAAWAEEQGEPVALLESASGGGESSRYSIVAYGLGELVEERSPGAVYEVLARSLSGRCDLLPCRDMLFGIVGFEAVVGDEPWLAKMMRGHDWPPLLAFRPRVMIVYDHQLGRTITCPGDGELGERAPGEWRGVRGLVYETPREDFVSWVEESLRLLSAGEFLQIVLSRVERYEYGGSPLGFYERLARMNPSPYMFYMSFPGGRWIAGSSPELLVKMEGGRLVTHPIAGTRPRGATPEEDLGLEEDLLSDEKELAEHLMLVDLARNDLRRVSMPGSVRVSRLMDVVKYASVQHIVSVVESSASPRVGYAHVLRAMNPAGTVSGAPKPRALEHIARMEDLPRGPYAGAAGMMGARAGETAIVIRSVWSAGPGLLETRAGAGIVHDSRPDKEYMETVHKLRAVKRALGVEGA